MVEPNDIVIRIHMVGSGAVDAKVIIQSLDMAEAALYASDRSDVENAATELHLKPYVRDASLERLRHHRNHRLLIEEVQNGSIVLVTVVAAVSLFVLEKTVGEAFADGVRETQLYAELREFFRRQIDAKTLFIAEALRRAFGSRKLAVSVQIEQGPFPGHHVIQVEVRPDAERRLLPPVASIGEHLRRERS